MTKNYEKLHPSRDLSPYMYYACPHKEVIWCHNHENVIIRRHSSRLITLPMSQHLFVITLCTTGTASFDWDKGFSEFWWLAHALSITHNGIPKFQNKTTRFSEKIVNPIRHVVVSNRSDLEDFRARAQRNARHVRLWFTEMKMWICRRLVWNVYFDLAIKFFETVKGNFYFQSNVMKSI